MSRSPDKFQKQSPFVILNAANTYSHTLDAYHELPKTMSKSVMVKKLANEKKEDIKYVIEQTKYKLQAFRKLEQIDKKNKAKINQKHKEQSQKIQKNASQLLKKQNKIAQDYNKHLKDVHTRYVDDEKKHRLDEKQQAYKLRKQLLQFYKKQQQNKQKAELKQILVSSCYKTAVERINNVHKQSQQRSLKAEIQLNKQLNKNNHLNQIVSKKRRSLSLINSSKLNTYRNSMDIFYQRQHKFIQKYGKNQDSSIKAFQHIDSQINKQKERIKKFFKETTQKWSERKKRVDAQKAQVPQKCVAILDKTTRSSFRKTVSAFRETSLSWNNKVQQNKSFIREQDDRKKDRLMSFHLDLRLKNNSSSKVNQKMLTMRNQARKLAQAYL